MGVKTFPYFTTALCLLGFMLPSHATELKSKITYQYTHNNNLMSAYKAADKFDDQTHTLAAGISYALALSQAQKLNFSATASYNQQQTFSMLDNTQVGLGIWYGWQNKFEYLAPYYIVSANVSKVNSQSDARDANKLDLTFLWNKRFTDVIQLRAGVNHTQTDANKRVFNQKINQVFSQLEYQFDHNWQLHGRVNYAFGQLVGSKRTSYCKDGAEVSQNSYQGDYNDQWYDYDINQNLCGHWYSYNYDGRYYSGLISVQYKLNAHKVALKYKRSWVHADNANTGYQKNELSLSYAFKF